MAQTNRRRGPFGWASKFFRLQDEDDFDVWTECSFQGIEQLVKRTHSAREGVAGFPEEFLAARQRLLQEWLSEAKPESKEENLDGCPAEKPDEKSEIAPFRNVFRRLVSAKGNIHSRSMSVPADMLGSLVASPYESHDSASTMNSKRELLGTAELSVSVPDFPESSSSKRLLGRSSDEVMAAEPRVDSAFSPTMRLKSFRDKVQRAFRKTGSGETPETDLSPLLDDY